MDALERSGFVIHKIGPSWRWRTGDVQHKSVFAPLRARPGRPESIPSSICHSKGERRMRKGRMTYFGVLCQTIVAQWTFAIHTDAEQERLYLWMRDRWTAKLMRSEYSYFYHWQQRQDRSRCWLALWRAGEWVNSAIVTLWRDGLRLKLVLGWKCLLVSGLFDEVFHDGEGRYFIGRSKLVNGDEGLHKPYVRRPLLRGLCV